MSWRGHGAVGDLNGIQIERARMIDMDTSGES
jgi:hypothetical protein